MWLSNREAVINASDSSVVTSGDPTDNWGRKMADQASARGSHSLDEFSLADALHYVRLQIERMRSDYERQGLSV